MTEKKIILIFGKRGSGKSYLAKKLIDKELRLMVFDTMSEYEGGVIFGTEEHERLLEFWRQVYRQNFRIIYRPIKPDAEIEKICGLVYTLGNCCFLVEEIDCYCTSYQISDTFAAIVQRGRHKNITLIGITQRPYGIHRLLTSQAKEIYIFNTNEPRDREYLRTLLGQEIEQKLDSLKQYEYINWQDGKEKLEIGKA
ncbi:MAG: AAA family ATPase [Sedimentisphaerales bacterium]